MHNAQAHFDRFSTKPIRSLYGSVKPIELAETPDRDGAMVRRGSYVSLHGAHLGDGAVAKVRKITCLGESVKITAYVCRLPKHLVPLALGQYVFLSPNFVRLCPTKK